MADIKKVKVKVKKRKLKIRNILIFLFAVILISLFGYYITTIKIQNIYITGTSILSDDDIIMSSVLKDYPSFVLTTIDDIKTSLNENDYIKAVNIKKVPFKICIEVEENKVLAIDNSDGKLILESGSKVDNNYNLTTPPLLINDISAVYDDFVKYFSEVDTTILTKISEIEYLPTAVDEERFLLYMNDGNYVYITLTKITKLNRYNSIKDELDGAKGIIYLDSGDYVEIKEKAPSQEGGD